MSILRELTEANGPEHARQDHIATNLPIVALWINDGLELEDAQCVLALLLLQHKTEVP
jgi:hypothetical protein